jgi:hypothetical protein
LWTTTLKAIVQSEKALKQAVYDKALPSKNVELGPAQRVLELLREPFLDRKVQDFLALLPWPCTSALHRTHLSSNLRQMAIASSFSR